MKTPSAFIVKNPLSGRTYSVSLAAVYRDYRDFLVEMDKVTRKEACAQIDKDPSFLETWFVEQFDWSDVQRMGVVIKEPNAKQLKKILDCLERDLDAGHPSSNMKVKR